MLEAGSSYDLNERVRRDLRTPLHWALAHGHAEIAADLVRHGADLRLADAWNVTGQDLLESPGPVSAEDALRLFGVRQRPPRKIERLLQPELAARVPRPGEGGDLREYFRSWPGGTGGWGPERLRGYEQDMDW